MVPRTTTEDQTPTTPEAAKTYCIAWALLAAIRGDGEELVVALLLMLLAEAARLQQLAAV